MHHYLDHVLCVFHPTAKTLIYILSLFSFYCFLIQIDDLMQQIYTFYRRSPKRWSELQKVASVLENAVVKPVRCVGTRWIDDRRRALTCMMTNYQSIVTLFEEQASGERSDIPSTDQSKIKGMLKILKSFKTVYYMSFYQDILEVLAALSRDFQRDDLPISEVRKHILLAQSSLDMQTRSPGPYLQKILDSINSAGVAEDGGDSVYFHNIKIDIIGGSETTYQRQITLVLNDLVSAIADRFCDFSDKVLLATEVFDPAKFALEELDELLEYGVAEVKLLTKHFQELMETKGCDVNKVLGEWQHLKLETSKAAKKDSFLGFWEKVLKTKKKDYPNLLHLVRIILVLPVSTAFVERTFSSIKRFQGDFRLSLNTDTLEDLLRVSTSGPEPEVFCTKPALERWWGACKRRPDRAPYGPHLRDK